MMQPQPALLIHCVGWEIEDPEFRISPHIQLKRFSGTPVAEHYQRLCYQGGVDDGDPNTYDFFVEVSPKSAADFLLNFGDPFSTADFFTNLIAVFITEPISLSRVMWSTDEFATIEGTHELFVSIGQSEFLSRFTTDGPDLDSDTASRLAKAWHHLVTDSDTRIGQARLPNALVFFYYAWRSYYIEQACLNLAVALEILFAPHYHAETNHQIAFNASRFMGDSPEERETIYSSIRKFYNARSSVVHGGVPSDDNLIDITAETFHRVSAVFRKILTDDTLSATFECDALRKEFLKAYTFE